MTVECAFDFFFFDRTIELIWYLLSKTGGAETLQIEDMVETAQLGLAHY